MMILATIGARGKSTHVATTQPAVKLTYEDYCATPADKRYELLDGELIMVPAPHLKHQRVQLELAAQLHQFIKDRSLGELFIPACDVLLSDNDVVQPVTETVRIHRLQGEILIPTRTFGREETLRSPLLSGLELHLDDIFPPLRGSTKP